MSSEEDLGGGSDDNPDHKTSRGQKKKATHAASKKETDLNEEGSIVLGDSDDDGLFSVFLVFCLYKTFLYQKLLLPIVPTPPQQLLSLVKKMVEKQMQKLEK